MQRTATENSSDEITLATHSAPLVPAVEENSTETASSGAEVHSLAGHDGTWESLKKTSHREWVADVVESAKRLGEPIFFGHSTSGLAGLVAEAENPGLFRAIAIVAAPLELRDWQKRLMLR